jgi:gluconolactonase
VTEIVVNVGGGFLEGPVWRPATGDLLVTAVTAGRILRVDVTAGAAVPFAQTEGGPNGAWPCADGGIVVTQNGGFDWSAIGVEVAEPSMPTTPGLQRVAPDGVVTRLTDDDGPFHAPNDLFVTADGTMWFTDPPRFPPPAEPSGRVWRWRPDGRPEIAAEGFTYCNGIGVDADGTVVIVEGLGAAGLLRLGADGSERSWLTERLPHGGDGFAFDVDGNLYVAGGTAVSVMSPGGEVLDILAAPDPAAVMTNCCFGGPDLRTLFATDGAGRVVAFDRLQSAGRRLDPLSRF